MYSIEWQKRGLPHSRILIWLKEKIHPVDIDKIISAEFPDPQQDPKLFDVVKKNHDPWAMWMFQCKCSVYERGKMHETLPKKTIERYTDW